MRWLARAVLMPAAAFGALALVLALALVWGAAPGVAQPVQDVGRGAETGAATAPEPLVRHRARPRAKSSARSSTKSSTKPSAKVRTRQRARPPARLRVRPLYPYRRTHSLYPLPYDFEYPGPNGKRLCDDSYVVEHRASGTVVVPRMRCRWVGG